MKYQRPYARTASLCVGCGGVKGDGLLVCWPCHRRLKVQHHGGYGRDIEAKLDVLDRDMKRQQQIVETMP